MRYFGMAVIAVTALTGNANAACGDYVGRAVRPLSFTEATRALKAVAPKSEFETTAAYESRRAAATAGLDEVIIASTTINRNYVKYDADKGLLNVDGVAFGQSYFDTKQAFASAGLSYEAYPRETRTGANIQFVVATEKKDGPSYTAKNAFGATVLVKTFERMDHVIFDRAAEPDFKDSDKPPYQAAQISMTPEAAMALKPSIKMGFVVDLSKAFMFTGSKHNEPTIDSPFESEFRYEVLMADMKCGLVMDAAGKVLAAPEMN